MSSGATWPSRSLVACTPELNPFASLLADCAKFIVDRLDCSLFQCSMLFRSTTRKESQADSAGEAVQPDMEGSDAYIRLSI